LLPVLPDPQSINFSIPYHFQCYEKGTHNMTEHTHVGISYLKTSNVTKEDLLKYYKDYDTIELMVELNEYGINFPI